MPGQLFHKPNFPQMPVLQGFTTRKKILKWCKKKKSIGSRKGKMPQKCQVYRRKINFFTRKIAFSPVTIRLWTIVKKCQVRRHKFGDLLKKTAFSPVTIRLWTIVKKCQVRRHKFLGEIFGMNFA